MVQRVPGIRIRALNEAPAREDGRFVLYWMVASRRRAFNFGLQRAAVVAERLDKPLVVLEPLRCGYRWANDRFHGFVLQGMADNHRGFVDAPVHYFPWVERTAGEGRGLLEALAQQACLVVSDDYPTFFIPRMLAAAGLRLDVRLEAVDSNGLLPMRAAARTFARAHDFRRFLHKNLGPHLEPEGRPMPDPLAGLSLPSLEEPPAAFADRWTPFEVGAVDDLESYLAGLPIDHEVPLAPFVGGAGPAEARWTRFAGEGLKFYSEGRNHPDQELSSGLSPWLHFGHISAHELFEKTAGPDWNVARLGKPTGKREGWWGLDKDREAFLDELVTWREVGFNMAHREPNHDAYEALPEWARQTLDEHRGDERPQVYDLETFERAETHDELWNAAQRQLRREGRIHNYLRMLWGKKILHWSESPEAALRVMTELNNKYALDGRDPNSYSGIFWVLGRYDRAWGPERPVFGKIRYMTSDSTRRKLKVGKYLARWAEP